MLRAGFLVCICGAVLAQQAAAPPLTFVVASIKPVGPRAADNSGLFKIIETGGAIRGGPGTADPERISYSGVSIARLLLIAYGMGDERTIRPKWADEERYDINVKVTPGATKEQSNLMLQNLLKERFGLQVHHEAKEKPGYAMVAAKSGTRLAKTLEPMPPGSSLAARHNVVTTEDGRLLATFRSYSAGDLAGWVSMMLSQGVPDYSIVPVADGTGLVGQFDFVLEFNRPSVPIEKQDGGLDLAGALEKQLGLKLESHKEPIDVLVVDRLEKIPTEN